MLEFIKEYVKINNVTKADSLRNIYQQDCIVPDTLPDIAEVLAVESIAFCDKYILNLVDNPSGNIKIRISSNILYMADSDPKEVRSFCCQTEYFAALPSDLQKQDQSLICKITPCSENVEYTVINSRKLSLRNMVRLDYKICSAAEIGFTSQVSGLDDLQQKSADCSLSNVVENASVEVALNEKCPLPGGKSEFGNILRSDPRLCEITQSLTGDILQIKGTLVVCTLYVDSASTLQVIENQLPFSENITISAEEEDICWQVKGNLISFNTEAEEDSDGEKRVLNISALIGISVEGIRNCHVQLLKDAYSLSKDFTLEKEELNICLQAGEISDQFVLKEVISKPQECPDINEIVNITGRMGQTDSKTENGKVITEGFIVCNILYMTKDPDRPLASFTQNLPFSQVFDHRNATEEMEAFLIFDINHISFSIISSQEIEIRVAILAKGSLTLSDNISIIVNCSDICDKEPDPMKPSFLIYVVQKGDTLWEIGKRYSASPQLLAKINDIEDPDLIYPGQKILIPR